MEIDTDLLNLKRAQQDKGTLHGSSTVFITVNRNLWDILPDCALRHDFLFLIKLFSNARLPYNHVRVHMDYKKNSQQNILFRQPYKEKL